jgi:hypothetical protein
MTMRIKIDDPHPNPSLDSEEGPGEGVFSREESFGR